MTEGTTRRRFLRQTFAFSAVAALAGCGSGQVGTAAATAPPVSPPGTPTTPQVASTVVNLLSLGDWGWDGDLTAQKGVSAAMQNYVAAEKFVTDAVLMLGDNFYGPLTGGANSARWKTQFEDMYPASAFNCPFYAMLGNHDYQVEPVDKTVAQLAYASQGTSRWQMPGRYYSVSLPEKNPILTLVVLDSNRPNEPAQPPPAAKSNYFTPTAEEVAAQQDWLQTTIAQPRTTPFRMVAAHHPVYSNGSHGDNNTLIGTVDPLLRKHAPQFYLAGHDHDMQHLEFAGHPTSFLLTGGGGAELVALRDHTTAQGPFAREIHGFTHLQVTAARTTVRMMDDKGNVLHSFQKTPEGLVTILS